MPDKDYEHVDETVTMSRDLEKVISIPIIDNNEWEPDFDFFVEIYDLNT